MRELVKPEQKITIVPSDFNFTNKGTVTEVFTDGFKMKVDYNTDGVRLKHICEFYSNTENGMLFFESFVKEIEGNVFYVANPYKHRFLQRRKFTRIKFLKKSKLYLGDEVFEIDLLDLSAGGIKLKSKNIINIEYQYKVDIPIEEDQVLNCNFRPIRAERLLDDTYIISGQFVNLINIDKMILIQYCMNKNLQDVNK